MAFTSHIFLFYFLPVLLALYHVLPARWLAARNILLLIGGYAFCGWIAPWLTLLLLGMTVVNYVLSRVIAGGRTHKTRVLATGCAVAFDLAVLGFFKYTMFLEGNINSLLRLAGYDTLPMLRVILPVGISFYTFKVISHVVDVYRKIEVSGTFFARAPHQSAGLTGKKVADTLGFSLLDFACYVSFLPQLLSGPIQRYGTIDAKGEIVPTFAAQLAHRGRTLEGFSRGVALFMLGFAKKILLADGVAQVADAVFAAASPGTLDVWFGALAYSFQLYFDFSAYSEMAIGLGQMFGFECPRNFDAPYRAAGFGDFWRRWHITLSSWLRDYLYIPLGGNRAGTGRTYVNLMLVFLLCGLWHGAGWTFIVWGAWHGLWLVVERAFGRRPFYAALPVSVRTLVTFLLITVGWVVFRATDLAEAGRMLAIMFLPRPAQGGSTLLSAVIYTRGHLILMALCVLLAFQPVQGFDWTRRLSWARILVLVALFALALMTMFAQSFRSFLYFQF